ncbi:hypothetical protein [Martelella mangrovi]|uniref:Protoheme IX farnesyltransferase n=1 Tax=Martelella mangrovi TaxID=1397477 RepID=A0ABV2IFZ0_9HYPH
MIETVKLSDKQRKARRGRNIALGVLLFGLVTLFYIITMVKFAAV